MAVEYFPRYIHRQPNLHTLDVVLLSFILRGRGRYQIDDETFAETGASLAVTHYGQHHDILTDRAGDGNMINLYLDLKQHSLPILPRPSQSLPLLLPLHPRFVHRHNRIVRLQFDDPLAPGRAALRHPSRTPTARAGGNRRSGATAVQAFLEFDAAGNASCATALCTESPPQPASGRLRRHLDRTFADRHTLAALATRARLGRTSLCRAFRRIPGSACLTT